MKTVRFATVVDQCGQPEAITIWGEPEHNRSLMAAIREKKIMTVTIQTVGTKKEFGRVGFFREKNVSYLLFPKSLQDFEGARIVGIKYESIRPGSAFGDKIKTTSKPSSSAPQRPAPVKSEPLAKFQVIIQREATTEVAIDIAAKTKSEAEEKAMELVDQQRFDLAEAKISNKVTRIERQ